MPQQARSGKVRLESCGGKKDEPVPLLEVTASADEIGERLNIYCGMRSKGRKEKGGKEDVEAQSQSVRVVQGDVNTKVNQT